ncbi:hypothetical protein [Sphingomonas sp.]|uniref:hypothetical protein n=1 Tax=Sphingomonas sp. TaxID=28214 RepID=UPI001D886B42|nr:hypothetical protein [Sphingomonas sp.]MBX9796468.1 hypothetical protein [Sphingomonas sp.]
MASIPLTPPANALTPNRVAVLIGFGLVLWAAGVVMLRWLADAGAMTGAWLPLVYAAVIPLTLPCIPLGPRLARLPASETARCTALVCATAVTIDGLVIGFVPWVYAADADLARAVAGCLLWAIGVALILGLIRRG